MKRFWYILLLLGLGLSLQAQSSGRGLSTQTSGKGSSPQTFWLGADISGTTDLEARGVQLRNTQGEPRENTALMRELGLNAVRLRVWVNPKDGLCAKDDVVRMAKRAKNWEWQS